MGRPKSFVMLFLLLVVYASPSHQRSVLQNTDCSYHSANYSVSWTYDELSNDVVFKLVSRSSFTNFYSAIAFGTGEQPEDVIAVYVRSAQIGLIDGHLVDDGAIESDEKTNVQALQFDLQNGVLSAQFARPIETFDSQDADLGNCVTIFLPTESREIITGVPLELGDQKSLQKIRVCDIAVTCATKLHNDVIVKRQEDSDVAPVCATGPEDQKNRIEWKVDGELIKFSVFQNTKKGRWWTAIGVGESMSDLNMILLFAETGKLKKQGIFRTEGKMQPFEVEYAGIELKKEVAVVNNGRAHFEVTIEKKFFLDRADEQSCFTMQVAILAGQYQPNFNIQKHQTTPQAIQICNVDACTVPTEPPQDVDGETNKGEEEKEVEKERVDVEASGVVGGATEPTNDVEGSGLSMVEQRPVATSSTPSTAEVADEKPLTGDDAPREESTTSSAAPTSSQSTQPPTPHANPVFVVDNQTTEKVEKAQKEGEEEGTETTTRKSTGCGAEHEDLKICESYFAEYLGKVNEWSEKHNMTITSHMWKACTLLSQVQHVTTMCCGIFRNTCATHLSL
ncbi:unnamed protein product [Caenorhabditis sp. 36 PRJEB53466]|nr:unnamed protein product [Caenorhabditis sp. 36 PRJEB53466]